MTPVDEWLLYRTIRSVIEQGASITNVVAKVSAELSEYPPGRELGTHDGDARSFLDIYKKRVLVSELTGHEIVNARDLVSALELYPEQSIYNASFCIGGRLVLIVYAADRQTTLGVIVSTTTDEDWW